MAEDNPPLMCMPVTKASWKYWCCHHVSNGYGECGAWVTYHHGCLEDSTGEHSQRNRSTLDHGLFGLLGVMVRIHKRDEETQQLRLEIL
jgi:hypothetical protein